MRRAHIELLSAARKGDVHARYELGRRYLLGLDGFQRHVPTGIQYLTYDGRPHHDDAAVVIAESLSLQDLLQFGQENVLRRAASAGSALACVKLGARQCLTPGQFDAALRLFEKAAAAGLPQAKKAVDALTPPLSHHGMLAALQATAPSSSAGDILAIALNAAGEALDKRDLPHLLMCLRVALSLASAPGADTAERVVEAVQLAQSVGARELGLDPIHVEACLDARVSRGDRQAAHSLGRALCGLASAGLAPSELVPAGNMRKGMAVLLRAADAGCSDAWMDLYRISARHESSVSNPHAARLYLEKAASAGDPEAQRKLGALQMREAVGIDQLEASMRLLSQAARQGDAHAATLLGSFVLPVRGSDAEAAAAVDQVRMHDVCLATRLELSRAFGLTPLEALTVDPSKGARSWGLVVDQNPFITQSRRAAPRAIPALSGAAMETLRRAASFFGQGGRVVGVEGNLRRRSLGQRRCFKRHGIDASLFFACAKSAQMEPLRLGSKWAFHMRAELRLALAE